MADDPQISLQAATIVSVGKDQPYPTGAPPDFLAVVLRVHTPQEQTDGGGQPDNPWERQSIQNLRAGGMIKGGAPGV